MAKLSCSSIAAVIPGGIAVTVSEQPIERSASYIAGCIPLRITHASFWVLCPHLREPPPRELIDGVVGEERSTLMRHG